MSTCARCNGTGPTVDSLGECCREPLPRYFDDAELHRLRLAMLAMGETEDATGIHILDGYQHMRKALYHIEKMADHFDSPRKLEEQMADEVALSLRSEFSPSVVVWSQFKSRFRQHVSSPIHDIAEVARRGAEMDDYHECLGTDGEPEELTAEVLDGRE